MEIEQIEMENGNAIFERMFSSLEKVLSKGNEMSDLETEVEFKKVKLANDIYYALIEILAEVQDVNKGIKELLKNKEVK